MAILMGNAVAQVCETPRDEARRTVASDTSLVAKHWETIAGNADDPALGPDKADAVLVEFIDYACPYCRAMAPDVLEIADEHPDIRIVFKEFPLIGGQASSLMARASIAAARQSGWRVFHEALMDRKRPPDVTDAILSAAETANLDLMQLEQDMFSHRTTEIIEGNCDLARKLGIVGTPAIVSWGLVIENKLPKSILRALAALGVDPDELDKQRQLYKAIVEEYDPRQYNYPDFLVNMLRKITSSLYKSVESVRQKTSDLRRRVKALAEEVERERSLWHMLLVALGYREGKLSEVVARLEKAKEELASEEVVLRGRRRFLTRVETAIRQGRAQ